MPFGFIASFTRTKVDSNRAKLGGAASTAFVLGKIVEICQCSRFSRQEGDAQRPEFYRGGLLGRIAEHILSPHNFEVLKTRVNDHCFQFCFQQSAGNSAGPQLDVFLCRFRDCFLNHEVGNLETAARLEYSIHFPENGRLVRAEVDHTV